MLSLARLQFNCLCDAILGARDFAMIRNIVGRARRMALARGILAASACVLSFALAAPANAKPTYTTFDPPGSTYTGPVGINNSNLIAGIWLDAGQIPHGFVRASDGTISTFDPQTSTYTVSTGLNDNGQVVGYFDDSNHLEHG